MATINLGAIKFNWKGAYNSGTSYAVDDVVSSGGNSYVCIQAHTTAQAVGNATAYWNIMSAKGTNGTDADLLSIGSTTGGDIYYNSGSAIARLPKGTAGQVLQMNSGATAPEYGTVSSDFVKILTADYSTAIANIDLDNIFSSTYRAYKIIVEDAYTAGSSFGELQLRYLDGSGSEISGSYYVSSFSGQYHSAGSSPGTAMGFDNNISSARLGNWNLSNGSEPYPNLWELNFGQMHLNAEHTLHFSSKVFDPNGNYDAVIIGGVRYAQPSVTRGIRLQINGGHNFAGYKITVYGLK
jgi:hypothetical protein